VEIMTGKTTAGGAYLTAIETNAKPYNPISRRVAIAPGQRF
jgi:hypothetical protein